MCGDVCGAIYIMNIKLLQEIYLRLRTNALKAHSVLEKSAFIKFQICKFIIISQMKI